MERFRPDSLLDGLLRPFLLADPTSFLYVEMMAPDFRFAALAVLGLLVALLHKRCSPLSSVQSRVVLLLVVVFYAWTFTSGNGRYFLPGLLLAGPVLVLFIRSLPISGWMRAFVILLILGLHVPTVVDLHHDDPWRVSEWHEGPAIGLAPSPLRQQPALFLKISANSFSALTPHFHPESRWVMLGGHLRRDIGSYERRRLSEVFASNLKAYAFAPKATDIMDTNGQPIPDIRRAIADVLAPYGFALTEADCQTIDVITSPTAPGRDARLGSAEGFWACPINRVGDIAKPEVATVVIPENHRAVFERFERACPRFFSPGGGQDNHFDGTSRRYYQGTDTQLQVWNDGMVAYRYQRSLNVTRVGDIQKILRNELELPCDRLVGRYRPPWSQDK